MQFYYGDKNIFRALDEAEFWKHQEAEHTVVIRLVTAGLEEEYVKRLTEFEGAFAETRGELVARIESAVRGKFSVSNTDLTQMYKLVKDCIAQSEDFIAFLGRMLKESAAVKKSGASQTVINHIIRESRYFTGIGRLILK